jgi:hypothetical protein
MLSFIETRLFTKLVLDYLADDTIWQMTTMPPCRKRSWLIRMPDQSSPALGAFGSCAGQLLVAASAVATE